MDPNAVSEDDETDSLLPTTTAATTKRKEKVSCGWFKLRYVLGWGVLIVVLLVFGRAFWKGNNTNNEEKSEQPQPSTNETAEIRHPHEQEWWVQGDVQTTTVLIPGQINMSIDDGDQEESLRWGIIGLGRIARDFATTLKMAGCNLTAVAAGSSPSAKERARKFAETYDAPRYYGTYEGLANDPGVDIVYIATTNQLHLNNTLLMLRHGKNVLVEKPMALNLNEARQMAAEAKKQKRFLLTNYWNRFFPVIKHTRELVSSGRLGPIMGMNGDFGFPAWPDRAARLLNRELGGGSMLDVGCYLVNMAVMVATSSNAAGTYPADITGTAQTAYLGEQYSVDTEMAFALRWHSDATQDSVDSATAADSGQNESSSSAFSMVMSGQSSIRRPSSFAVEVQGTRGRIMIHDPANAPFASTVYEYEPFGPLKHIELVQSKDEPAFDETYGPERYPGAAGFIYIIQDVTKCMKKKGIPGRPSLIADGHEGCLEMEELTLEEQLVTVEITDEVLRKAGVL